MPIYDVTQDDKTKPRQRECKCTVLNDPCAGCQFNAFVAKPSEPYPGWCRVWDAAGEWVPYTCRVDTETGEVVRLERTADDTKYVMVGPPERLWPNLIYERRPAPLTLESIGTDEPYKPPTKLRFDGSVRGG